MKPARGFCHQCGYSSTESRKFTSVSTPCVHGFEQLCVPKVHNKAKIPILSIGIERDRSRLLTEKCK